MSMNKNEYKTLADAVGMPDDEDKRYIQRLLVAYDKKHPGEIQFHRDAARARQHNEWNVVDEDSHRRYLMEMPAGLHEKLEAYIPTLFREKKHFAWFCKNFPELMIPKKY